MNRNTILLLVCMINIHASYCFIFSIRDELAWYPSNPIECSSSVFKDMIPKNGRYIIEKHLVETEDGYLLNIFRVNLSQSEKKKLSPSNKKNIGRPIFAQHGILDAADNFFMNGEDGSPGFWLINKGFDVWFGNNRGNKYSIGHKNTMTDQSFFDFTFEDFGLYDIPACYHKILEITAHETIQPKKIIYLGHSQGTQQMWVALSDPTKTGEKTRKYLAENTDMFVSLAPIYYLNEINLPFILNPFYNTFENHFRNIMSTFGVYDIMTNKCQGTNNWTKALQFICTNAIFGICKGIASIFGRDESRDNVIGGLDKMLNYNPAGMSVKNLVHLEQLVNKNSSVSQKYDYGNPEANKKAYGSELPPQYNPE